MNKSSNKNDVAEIQGFLADNLRYQGKYPEAMEARMAALSYYEQQNDSAKIVEAWMGIGVIHLMMEKYGEAEQQFKHANRWYESQNDSTGLGFAETALSLAYYRFDSLDAAISHGFRSFQIREALGDIRGKGESLNNLALIYMAKGAWSQAKDYLEASLNFLEK